MIPALTDYLVVDLTTQLPGPYCSMLLADLGARVIKVEPPGGDPLRGFPPAFASVNRGKRDIVIDLKNDAGREVMSRLVSRADVVLEGFRPAVAERLGVDYPSARRLNPAIVYCAISRAIQDRIQSVMDKSMKRPSPVAVRCISAAQTASAAYRPEDRSEISTGGTAGGSLRPSRPPIAR